MKDIIEVSKSDLIKRMLSVLVTPNISNHVKHSEEDICKYNDFVNKVLLSGDLPKDTTMSLDFATKDKLFNLIKCGKVFIKNSIKFNSTFTVNRPNNVVAAHFDAKYRGNEFNYSFLDNHPGIINVDRLKDIPTDYEGLMAVPPTVLEYKNIIHFNIYRVIYTPKHNGKFIYPRIVVSNKVIAA